MNTELPQRATETLTLKRFAIALALCVALVLMFVQYMHVKHSYFDDTFIYLHIAQNAVERGSWQYFPNTERPALLASSPLRIVVLTFSTLIAWPFTHGARTLESAALILPLSAIATCLVFLPFWWRDRWRFLLLAVPYFVFAATFEAVAEFEAGLLYWWVATLVRDYVERIDTKLAAFAVAVGAFIRPDVAIVVLTALSLSYGSRGELGWRRLRLWAMAGIMLAITWITLCAAFGVWPLPTTYWAKGALPTLFDSSQMISFLSPRLGESAIGAWQQEPAVNAAISFAWLTLVIIIAAQSSALAGWRLLVLLVISILLLSRLPATYYWYYQNMWIAGAAAAIALYVCQKSWMIGRIALVSFVFISLAVPLAGRLLRESAMPWDFAKPSRAQGYLAMANTFDRAGTIELPGLGRGYLKNPEVGITAYFGGRNSWIWDSAGLVQPHPNARDATLGVLFRNRLHKPPTADIQKLSAGRIALPVFEAWALDNRDPAAHARCRHVVFDGSVCVSNVLPIELK
jgi:hypothetical protein